MMYVVNEMRVSLLVFQVSHGRDTVNQLTAALLVDAIGRGPAMAVSVDASLYRQRVQLFCCGFDSHYRPAVF